MASENRLVVRLRCGLASLASGVSHRNGRNRKPSRDAETEQPLERGLASSPDEQEWTKIEDFGHALKRRTILRTLRDLKASRRRVYGHPPSLALSVQFFPNRGMTPDSSDALFLLPWAGASRHTIPLKPLLGRIGTAASSLTRRGRFVPAHNRAYRFADCGQRPQPENKSSPVTPCGFPLIT